MVGWLLRLLMIITGAALATPVLAHATLTGSDPVEGSVISMLPSIITLRFNEPVSPISLRLLDDRSVASDLTRSIRSVGNDLIVVPPPTGEGTHALVWRVTSADGHPIGGTLVFSIGRVTAGTPQTGGGDLSVAVAVWLTHVLLYVGLFAGVGGTFFTLWVAGRPYLIPRLRRVLLAILGLGLISAVLALGAQGADVLGQPLAALFGGDPWQAALATSYAATIGIAMAAMGLAAAPLLDRVPGADHGLSAVALAGVGAALAVSGHASDAPAQSLAWFAIFVHGVAVAFWVGSLVPLALLLLSRRAGIPAVLARFSRAIPYAVAALIVAGVFLAVLELQQPADLWTTPYGQVLSAKLVVVVALLALAFANRVWLTPAIAKARPFARPGLTRSIGIELALVAVAFGVVALWRFTPPPRALAAAATLQPVFAHVMQAEGKAMAEITITPGRAGPVAATLIIMDGRGMPIDPAGVSLALSNPAAGIEPIARTAVKSTDGTWRIEGVTLPFGGTWQAEVTVLLSAFDQVTLEGPVILP